jgi:hypothetical protein
MVSVQCNHARTDCIDFSSEIRRIGFCTERNEIFRFDASNKRSNHDQRFPTLSGKTTSASYLKIVLALFHLIGQAAPAHLVEFFDGPRSTWLRSTHSS